MGKLWFFFRAPPEASTFLTALRETCGTGILKRYGRDEPLRKRFDPGGFANLWDAGEVGWRCSRPWGEGRFQRAMTRSLDDSDIAPPNAPKVDYLWWDYDDLPRDEAAQVFDAIASTTDAYAGYESPLWSTTAIDPTPVRDWWLGLPPVTARRWWLGRGYTEALGGDRPETATAAGSGTIISAPKWLPPERLSFSDFSDSDWARHNEEMSMLTSGSPEWHRARWRGLLWVHPAVEIPSG